VCPGWFPGVGVGHPRGPAGGLRGPGPYSGARMGCRTFLGSNRGGGGGGFWRPEWGGVEQFGTTHQPAFPRKNHSKQYNN